MALGKACLVIEESLHSDETRLLSVLSPRKSNTDIAEYLEQSYVDRFASFEEAISYKKKPQTSAFRIEEYNIGQTLVACGQEPIYRAYLCHWLKVAGKNLAFRYWVFKRELGNQIKEEHVGEVVLPNKQL